MATDRELSVDEARVILGNMRGPQLGRSFITSIDVRDEPGSPVTVDVRVGRRPTVGLLVAPAMQSALSLAARTPGRRVRLVIRREPQLRVAVRTAPVPGFGWRMLGGAVQPTHPVAVEETDTSAVVDNGLVRVEVVGPDLVVDGLPGFDLLVDGGDVGDTYNYSPPAEDLEVRTPVASRWEILEPGPVRARVAWYRTYHWPTHADAATRHGSREVEVTTVVELHADDPLVRVTTTFENSCRDHRLRAVFPVPDGPVERSEAECAFAVVTRGLEAEGGPHERALPTFPSRRFVRAGALTVVHEGLLEYELVHGGRALALTLLRATGMLSRVEAAYRPLPAGPPIPVAGAQMLGPLTLRYAFCLDPTADPYALVDDAFLPLRALSSPGGGTREPEGTALTVAGAEVSALRRVPGGLELRVFNPRPVPTDLHVPKRSGWVVDLRGRPLEPFEDSRPLRPFEICTLVLTDPNWR
ncbi:MAG: hypothetical protein C4344_03190 [Acidimicrobiia bacterium]